MRSPATGLGFRGRRRLVGLAFLLFALCASPAFAKSLHWRALDVEAKLDRDGRLHIAEKHVMVFDGAWNGGERTFDVRDGQQFKFESIVRVDSEGEHRLIEGDVDEVDHFLFLSPTTLRWRSRLPSDPPFAKKEITYLLRYTLGNVLRMNDGGYGLAHDFAFPLRDGVIETFSLRFDLDPIWRGVQSPIVIHRENLAPGESVVVRLQLAKVVPAA
jgi:hypothetical protein